MDKLQLLINSLFDRVTIEDTHLPHHKMIQGSLANERSLLFVKPITGEIAFFNMSISDKTFGAELIHAEDFHRLQLLMDQMNLSDCVYVIHSLDKDVYTHQFTFPYDPEYIEWISDE